MKNYIFITVLTMLLAACNQQELADAKREKDSLISVVSERDAAVNEFIGAFNEVERNLDSVAVRQHLISVNADKKGELELNQKVRINTEINAINKLMDENRKKLSELNRKLKSSARNNAALEKTIAIITSQLQQKDIELLALNEKLNNLNAQVIQLQTAVTTLTEDNVAKDQIIMNETVSLHTAYFIVGKSKELQDAKIIDRKGGLLGIGKTAQLTGDFDNSKFSRIDYTQTSVIPVNSEMKMITSHPTSSYSLEKEAGKKDLIKNIVITDAEKFWSTSKYLVIIRN